MENYGFSREFVLMSVFLNMYSRRDFYHKAMAFKKEKKLFDPTYVINANETWKETLNGEWTRTIIKTQIKKLDIAKSLKNQGANLTSSIGQDSNAESASETVKEKDDEAPGDEDVEEDNLPDDRPYPTFSMEDLAKMYRIKQKIIAGGQLNLLNV